MSFESFKSGIENFLYWNVRLIPDQIQLAHNAKKFEKAEDAKAAKEIKKAKAKSEERNGDELLSERLKSDVVSLAGNDQFKRLQIINRALAAKQLIDYAYYYMTDDKAELIKLNQTEKEICNAVAEIFEFGKIFESAGVADLKRYDYSFKNDYIETSKYLLSLEDIYKVKRDQSFTSKVNVRKVKLGKVVVVQKDIIKNDLKKEEKKIQMDEAEKVNNERKVDTEKINRAGEKGEEEVDYALRWISKSYHVIEKTSKRKDGKKCILIKNADYIDEIQEIDHVVVGEQGVFLIETKYYAGDIIIDEHGDWKHLSKDGAPKAEANPLQQMRRHEKLVKSIVPKDVDIISILCLAHKEVSITGREYFPLPIVRSDMLAEYIENYDAKTSLSEDEIKKTIDLLKQHMV